MAWTATPAPAAASASASGRAPGSCGGTNTPATSWPLAANASSTALPKACCPMMARRMAVLLDEIGEACEHRIARARLEARQRKHFRAVREARDARRVLGERHGALAR